MYISILNYLFLAVSCSQQAKVSSLDDLDWSPPSTHTHIFPFSVLLNVKVKVPLNFIVLRGQIINIFLKMWLFYVLEES